MSGSTSFLVLFIGSVILGIGAGEWFYRALPPPTMESSAMHMGFLLHGALIGLAIFLWTLLVLFVQRLTGRRGSASAPHPPVPPP